MAQAIQVQPANVPLNLSSEDEGVDTGPKYKDAFDEPETPSDSEEVISFRCLTFAFEKNSLNVFATTYPLNNFRFPLEVTLMILTHAQSPMALLAAQRDGHTSFNLIHR